MSTSASTGSATSINPREASHFGAMAVDWWNPAGSSAMLHRLNPVRLRYVRDAVDRHFGLDPRGLRPLTGKTVLDVGCGAGLMCEPLARLGAAVTGIDAAPENAAVAQVHAAGQGLSIDYRCGDVAEMSEQFDVVTAMEVIEHVVDPGAFVAALGARIAPGGVLIISTPNRTTAARFGLIAVGETIGGIPKGTHDYDKLLTPDQLGAHLGAAGLTVIDQRGLSLSLAKGFMLSDDLRLNYLVTAIPDDLRRGLAPA